MIRAKKNSWKEIPDENKIPTLKKTLSWRIVVKKKFLLRFMSGKNSITRGLGRKIYPNQIKSQMVGVKVYNNVLTMTYEHHIRPVLNNILP